MRVPVSTPGGILTVSARRVRTRPSPAHSAQGCGITVPKPWQAGHGREVMTWPRKRAGDLLDLAAAPADVAGAAATVPGAVPAPGQVAQTTAVSTWISRVAPKAASARSMSSRIKASWPRRCRGRGPARRAAAAEEGVHDVGEAEARPEAAAGRSKRVAAEVVQLALLRVGEHLVGGGDLLEPLLLGPG